MRCKECDKENYDNLICCDICGEPFIEKSSFEDVFIDGASFFLIFWVIITIVVFILLISKLAATMIGLLQ